MPRSAPARARVRVLSALAALTAGPVAGAAQGGPVEPPAVQRDARPIHEIIRTRIESGSGAVGPVIIVRDERIHAAAELPRFYESRAFMPAWVREEGPTALADSLLRAIEQASREGLAPPRARRRAPPQGDPRWTSERIATVASAGTETTVPLPRPIQVHLLYWTAWAEPDGTIHFRPDIYDRDAALDRALAIPPPIAARNPAPTPLPPPPPAAPKEKRRARRGRAGAAA